jgi:pyruvate,water dikinase
MAVIIQEMVDSDYSGICFTINPMSGKDKEMLIEVAPGLGENIVSGKVSPEQYYYNWYDDKEIIKEKNKYLKSKQIKEYTKIFINIQRYFGYPCDIEFAIKKEKLYILQARKITKIKYGSYKDLWSTADFKDGGVSASVCTPYMWSLYEYI